MLSETLTDSVVKNVFFLLLLMRLKRILLLSSDTVEINWLQGHFTLFGRTISADVNSGVGSVYVELTFQALLLSRTIVAFDLSSLSRPILRAPLTQLKQILPSYVCVLHSKRHCIVRLRCLRHCIITSLPRIHLNTCPNVQRPQLLLRFL